MSQQYQQGWQQGVNQQQGNQFYSQERDPALDAHAQTASRRHDFAGTPDLNAQGRSAPGRGSRAVNTPSSGRRSKQELSRHVLEQASRLYTHSGVADAPAPQLSRLAVPGKTQQGSYLITSTRPLPTKEAP